MSKRRAKRQHRKQVHRRQIDRSVWPDEPGGLIVCDGDDEAAPTTLEIVEYTIVHEPMDDRVDDGPPLPPHKLKQLDSLGARLIDGATDLIEPLESLLLEFPLVPRLYNYLAVAYGRAGRRDDTEELIEKCYEMFPAYLFAFANFVNLCVTRGLLDEAERIIDKRFAIHLFLTKTRTYHITDFVAFNLAIGQYWLARGDIKAAERYYLMLRDVAPEHPHVQNFGLMTQGGFLRRAMSRIRAMTGRMAGRNLGPAKR